MVFSRVGKIACVNLKHNFLIHMGLAVLLALFTRVLFDVTALDSVKAAQPIEMFLCLAGAVVLVPVFLPEQDVRIQDVIRSKRVDYLLVCLLRVLYASLFLALLVGGFVFMMKLGECQVTMRHFIGGFASAFLLGAVGFVAAGISKNTTIGYMVAFIYYMANIAMKEKLGWFFLFSMYAGKGENKESMLVIGVVLVLGTLSFLKLIR